MRRFLVLALISVLAAPGASMAQGRGTYFDPLACQPGYCAESHWIQDDSHSDHTTSWRHDLGATPRSISLLFSPDPDQRRVIPVVWPWNWQTSGNPISIEMGRRMVQLHIWSGANLHGVWRPEGGWQHFREGYWKIIVYR